MDNLTGKRVVVGIWTRFPVFVRVSPSIGVGSVSILVLVTWIGMSQLIGMETVISPVSEVWPTLSTHVVHRIQVRVTVRDLRGSSWDRRILIIDRTWQNVRDFGIFSVLFGELLGIFVSSRVILMLIRRSEVSLVVEIVSIIFISVIRGKKGWRRSHTLMISVVVYGHLLSIGIC